MNYQHHLQFNIFFAVCFTLYCLSKHIQNFDSVEFWAGVILYSLVITPDLDHSKSRVSQIWDFVGLGFIWHPFQKYGHREALHHPAWGPFIQVVPVWIICQQAGVGLGIWFFAGCVFALEGHILVDKIYSRLR